MTDKFSIIPLKKLLALMLDQLDSKNQFFGIPKQLFYKPDKKDPFRSHRFGQLLETPLGIAAGPHTQLAQNIVAAWLCGARYMELKTIQTLDNIEVSKPCIDMQDEGYNCEWSQELKIHESFDQYLNAWILIYLLKHKFGWEGKELGTIFNMSVGYDLMGIMNDNVQWFFNKMQDCSAEKQAKVQELSMFYPEISTIEIPNCISNNVTLSTMHGCPPEEIERIGKYLIEDKKLHTTIKLNPTLLGKEKLCYILGKSGFETNVPDAAFGHDLIFPDAIKIIKSLQHTAAQNNLHFGLKLTNTLESQNHKNIFSSKEKRMYMSGRALHPISVNLASKLQTEFNGMLDISFSAGVNAYNFQNVIACGLTPATVCSDILKPGGYGLLGQYLDNLRIAFKNVNAKSIDEFILRKAGKQSLPESRIKNLNSYSQEVLEDKAYQKEFIHDPDIKTDRKLKSFDCIQAPCIGTCPTNQDIPDYMYYTAKGDFQKAFQVIMRMNPFPNTTGMVCDHLCQTKCTRINYDKPLLIREIKRFIAEKEYDSNLIPQKLKKKLTVAVIGAGPSGLSCAYFLALAGIKVEVFENKNQPGGMVSAAIPTFRLTNEAFTKDIERIEKLGVNIKYNKHISKKEFTDIRNIFDYVYIATGAPESRKFNIEGKESKSVIDPLNFLFRVKEGQDIKLGNNIAIIGGGNTAMDAARTAYRLVGKNRKVSILYRRTIGQMPADGGEIKAVMEEGMEILELVLPIRINSKNGHVCSLTCIRMKLSGTDSAGRPKPVEIPGSEFDFKCDTIIPAIGQDHKIDFIDPKLLKTESGIYETKAPDIFIGGDALRGASTAINAIGDGRKAVSKILEKAGIDHELVLPKGRKKSDYQQLMIKRSIKSSAVHVKEIPLTERKNFNLVTQSLSENEATAESSRCLLCDEICNTCVTVCPNLALYFYFVDPVKYHLQKLVKTNGKFESVPDRDFVIEQSPQILQIADWCNECGNCTTFCPTSGAPYREKPHLYLNKEAFEKDDDCYFLDNSGSNPILLYRKDGYLMQFTESKTEFVFSFDQSEIKLAKQNFAIKEFKLNDTIGEIDLKKAAEMRVVLVGAKALLVNSKPQFQSRNKNNSPFKKGAGGIQKTHYLPYNKNLKRFSRNLRNDSTLGEVLLWKELRAKKLEYIFNRQKPILNYIVDFYCKPLNLVIEVDGSSHDNDDAIEKDTKRQHDLETIGLNFLRFDDREVKKDIENVIREIKAKIKEIEKGGSS
jgi:putative selenate reductase